MTKKINNFCCTLKDNHNSGKRLIGLSKLLWKRGDNITISFMGGTTTQHEQVLDTIKVYSLFTGLTFTRVTVNGMIRVAFRNEGSWSMIGKDCLDVPLGQPTMNFSWLDKGVILHEFGHAIGMIHEHQNPKGNILWNKDQVYKDLGKSPNNWDKATIDYNMFDKPLLSDTVGSELDDKSIMMYRIPPQWTLDGFETSFNESLSEKDKITLLKLYPGEVDPEPTFDNQLVQKGVIIREVISPSMFRKFSESEILNLAAYLKFNGVDKKNTKSQNIELLLQYLNILK